MFMTGGKYGFARSAEEDIYKERSSVDPGIVVDPAVVDPRHFRTPPLPFPQQLLLEMTNPPLSE